MSDSSRARTAAEVIGLVGVIASLVFVGLEIRQNAEATETATVQDVVDGWRDINIWLASDASWHEARRAFLQADDPSQLDHVASLTLRAGWRTLFHQWMVGHYHHTAGTFPEDLWTGFEVEIESLRDEPTFLWAWEADGWKFAPSFQTYMNNVLAR